MEKFAEPARHVLGSEVSVNGLQEVQLAGQFVRLLIWLRYVVVGFGVHWTSFQRRGRFFAVDLTPRWAGLWS